MLILLLTSLAILQAEISAWHLSGCKLNDGNRIPAIGLGTFIPKGELGQVKESVINALTVGYRFIDTAPIYLTEELIGQAIKNVTSRRIVRRDELFITSKFDNLTNPKSLIQELQNSLQRLQLDYLDLYLIHNPMNVITGGTYDILAIWNEMEKAKKLGLTKSIGLSNFNSSHINKILTYGNIRPAVNEVEVNPSYTNLDLVAYCQREGITVISYGSHGFTVPRPFRNITTPEPSFNNTLLVKIAKKYHKTTNQVILRYLVDRSVIPLVKSTNKMHIEENLDIFDFKLSNEEVYQINEFNQNINVYVYNEKDGNAILQYYYGETVQELYKQLNIT